MRFLASTTFFLLLCLVGSVAQSGDPKKDHDKIPKKHPLANKKPATEKELAVLQGDWKVQWFDYDGEKQFPDRTYTIREDKSYEGKDEKCLLKVDPTCSPKLLDVTFTDQSDLSKGRTAEGIYKVDGDTMVWCWSTIGLFGHAQGPKQRPLEFRAEGSKFIHGHPHSGQALSCLPNYTAVPDRSRTEPYLTGTGFAIGTQHNAVAIEDPYRAVPDRDWFRPTQRLTTGPGS